MRQTDLTLERILQELSLEGNKSVYRPCMLVNEIGAIYNEKKDEESESESERALLALLEDKEPSYRAIAFCFLYSDKDALAKHHGLLAEFRCKPENQQLMDEIDVMVFKFQQS